MESWRLRVVSGSWWGGHGGGILFLSAVMWFGDLVNDVDIVCLVPMVAESVVRLLCEKRRLK